MTITRNTTRPRWQKLLVAVLVSMVALELALQLGAMAIALCTPAPTVMVGSGVLCVGDSFTFGVGARSPATSYPGQLPAALAARGMPGVQVTNGGYPGSHSGDILGRLPSQLTPATKVLCVMIGTNDSWRRPPRVDEAALARRAPESPTGGFQWRWRTARLWQLLTRFELGSWQPTAGDAATAATATAPAASGPSASAIAAGFALLARSGLPVDPACTGRYAHDPALPGQRGSAFWQAAAGDDADAAAAIADGNARDFPDSPSALLQVVNAATRRAHRDQAEAALTKLAALHAAKPTPASLENLMIAQQTAGQNEAAMASARQRIADEPLSLPAWDTLQQVTFVLGRREESMAAMVETVRMLGPSQPQRTGFIARNYARWLLTSDVDCAVRVLLGAWLVDGDAASTRIALMIAQRAVDRSRIETAIEEFAGRDQVSTRTLAAIVEEVYAGKGAAEWCAVLGDHLRAVHRFARARGVAVVLVSYPFRQHDVERAQRDMAQASGLPFVAVHERFEREIAAGRRAELFVADGHCTDAGYGLIAELVAEAIAPLLR